MMTEIAPPMGRPSTCFTSVLFTLKTPILVNFSRRRRKINRNFHQKKSSEFFALFKYSAVVHEKQEVISIKEV